MVHPTKTNEIMEKKEDRKRKAEKTDNNESRPKQLKFAKNGNEVTLTVAKSLQDIQVDFNKNLVKWITDTLQPFSAVEKESFKKMIAAVNPSLRIMCRKTLMRNINESYIKMMDHVKGEMAAAHYIGVTADAWTAFHRLAFSS